MNLSIPGYEIFDAIGSGGMAEVYRARHIRLDREVALKVMLDRFADDATFGDRFIREARIAANLNHPHIVQIYDVNRCDGTFFLAMEYLKDGDLRQRLAQSLTKDSVAGIVRDLSAALDYAHERGYIHRDIKPANILFRDNGSLALSDFGIARAIHSDTHMTQTGMVVGTPSYMSPEQAQGKPLGGGSDLYSVAVIAYQLVAGELPYQAESSISVAIKHINEPIPRLGKPLAPLQPFFNRALAKSPDNRFPSGAEMAQAFVHYLGRIDRIEAPSNASATNNSGQRDRLVPTEFTAVSLEAADISELETEALACTTGGKPTAEVAAQPDSAARDETSGLSGVFVTASQATMRMVFMQINRVKVFVMQSHKVPSLLMLALLVAAGVGPFVHRQIGLHTASTLSPGREIRIGQLLEGADGDIAAGKLIAPAGDNAYEKYLAILALSPSDPVAQDGIADIAGMLRQQSRQALAQGDLDRARSLLAELEIMQPRAVDNRALRENIARRTQKATTALNAKLAAAGRARKEGDVAKATSLYRAALTLDNDDNEASGALAIIASQQTAQAETQIAKRDLAAARTSLEHAKSAAAALNDKHLIAAIEPLQKALLAREKNRRFEDRINTLLRAGSSALANGRLDNPAEDNAHFYYRQVLAQSPRNQPAKQGLDAVYERIIANVDDYLDKGRIDNAQLEISRLERLKANHPSVGELRQRLALAREIATQKAAQNDKVSRLYQRADIYLARGRARSADKIHAQIARLNADDPGLQKLGARIADAYVGLAQKEIDARDWRDVAVWVQKGLQHVPDHRQLLQLQAYADQQIAKRR